MSFDCPRFGKLVGSCRFEPRYDDPPARELTKLELHHNFPCDPSRLIESVRGRIYVRDVCIRCGRTVERPKVKA